MNVETEEGLISSGIMIDLIVVAIVLANRILFGVTSTNLVTCPKRGTYSLLLRKASKKLSIWYRYSKIMFSCSDC